MRKFPRNLKLLLNFNNEFFPSVRRSLASLLSLDKHDFMNKQTFSSLFSRCSLQLKAAGFWEQFKHSVTESISGMSEVFDLSEHDPTKPCCALSTL